MNLNYGDGFRGIATAVLGIIITIAGWLFGPIDIGTVHIPAIPFETAVIVIWGALMFIFNSIKGNKIKAATAKIAEELKKLNGK